MSSTHLDDYEPREWEKLGELNGHSDDLTNLRRSSQPPEDLVVCESNSKKADKLSEDDLAFFSDEEQTSAGVDDYYPCEVRQLATDWDGHDEGKLVMIVCTDDEEDPPVYTVFIEE